MGRSFLELRWLTALQGVHVNISEQQSWVDPNEVGLVRWRHPESGEDGNK